MGLPSTKGYIEALAKHLNKLPSELVSISEDPNGDTFGHTQIALDLARWVSIEFRVWANEVVLRGLT